MKKFFKMDRQEQAIKQSLLTNLNDTVKQIQYFYIQDNELGKNEDIREAYNSLCTVIEAMFLHGLRDPISLRLRRAIADVDERPESSFWPALLTISHRQIAEQISNLSQINSEVGKCRAWIRTAMNDGLLSSYFATVRRESPLKSFYQQEAFLRDPELMELAQKLLESVEEFKTVPLPHNSSILNAWTAPSLSMAGVWTPTMKANPVAPCDDVAQMVEETKPDALSDSCSLSSAMSVASLNSGLRQMVALNEEEALRIILAKGSNELGTPDSSVGTKDCRSSDEELEECSKADKAPPQGNCLPDGGWSMDCNKSNETSFNSLLESYNRSTIDSKQQELTKKPAATEEDNEQECEKSLAECLYIVMEPKGVDMQDNKCESCKQEFNETWKPRVCAFTSKYFCDSCMADHEMPIPARMIRNWDFEVYPVSQDVYNYLNKINKAPIIDLKKVNQQIYRNIAKMEELLVLRNQLSFIRAYLYTCRGAIIEELQSKMRPREYMYEHIHLYSIADLCDIPTGVLSANLKSVVDFGREHVINCWLCSQKGFFCEICRKSDPLFPFDIEHVYRCDRCYAVYHKECMSSSKPCPKCTRKKERDELPLVGATTD